MPVPCRTIGVAPTPARPGLIDRSGLVAGGASGKCKCCHEFCRPAPRDWCRDSSDCNRLVVATGSDATTVAIVLVALVALGDIAMGEAEQVDDCWNHGGGCRGDALPLAPPLSGEA